MDAAALSGLLTMATVATAFNLAGKPGLGYLVQVLVGTPPQQFNVLVDTGSANFAIAGAPHPNVDRYFRENSSSTYVDLEELVSIVYTQGTWSGELAHDVVYFPTLNSVPSVACDVTFITDSHEFFVNGSDWQGILGLAYSAIARPSPDVKSWIDYLQKENKDKTIAFSLTLCGSERQEQNYHTGSFEILNNVIYPFKGVLTAAVVREWFYEIILTGLFVDGIRVPVECRMLNVEQTIVDSGTTNVRLPKTVFSRLVELIMKSILNYNTINEKIILIDQQTSGSKDIYLDGDMDNLPKEFWLEQKVACCPFSQTWKRMPTINIEVASGADSFFRINLPPSSYIRRVYDNEDQNYCYQFAIEPSTSGSIIGVIALEGFQVIFNRTAKTVGFLKSNCGPDVSVEGPFSALNENLIEKCWHKTVVGISLLRIAAYIVCIALFFASCMFVYFFVQWIKNKYFKYRSSRTNITISHASLINNDTHRDT